MTVPTLFARGPFAADAMVTLDEDEAHHLRVRRVPDGAPVRLVDGQGAVATACLALGAGTPGARVVAVTVAVPPPPTELLVGAGDRDRFLDLIEAAVELGVTRIVPLVTARSRAVATRFQSMHIDKAARRAREAVKQSGAAWLPRIESPVPIADVLGDAAPGIRLLADAGGGPLRPLDAAAPVRWAVGPEGGFTPDEANTLRGAGFMPVALGRATLRFATAALAALALTAQARLSTS